MSFSDQIKKKPKKFTVYPQEKIGSIIKEDEKLSEQIIALCSMDFLPEFVSLDKIDDSCAFNMAGKVFARDGGGYYIFLDDGTLDTAIRLKMNAVVWPKH